LEIWAESWEKETVRRGVIKENTIEERGRKRERRSNGKEKSYSYFPPQSLENPSMHLVVVVD
jgi:hypothetical protein